MSRILMSAAAVIALFLSANLAHAQKLLETKGWGSLSGKVTLDGKIPAIVDLVPKMMIHADKDCCLAKGAITVDDTWIVDPKTKGVANVVVWIRPPEKTYFPTHEKLKVRKEEILIDQPNCAFFPRISAHQPFYRDNGKEVATGQTLIIRNSAVVPHNVRATGGKANPGFNKNMPPKTENIEKFNPQPLPITLQCDVHGWMGAKLFVFDHPYYAKTKEDGTFEIPFVPAGAEITLMAWHEADGYAVWTTNGDKRVAGKTMTLKEGKNEFNITIGK